jgi:hypothetical protein
MLVDRAKYPKTPEGKKAWEAASGLVAAEHIKKMTANSGHAGAALIQYILANRDEVHNDIQTMLGKFTEVLSNPKFRFYRAHSACTIVIAKIARKLGIMEFDIKQMYKFTVNLLRDLADSVAENNTVTSEDAFQRMVSILSARIIVTTECRDRRDGRGPETPRNRVNGPIAGRYILGTQSNKEFAGRLILSQKEVRDWCMANRMDFHSMLTSLQEAKALVAHGDKFVITRGTDCPSMQTRCIIVDMHKLNAEANAPVLSLVSNQFDGEAAEAV